VPIFKSKYPKIPMRKKMKVSRLTNQTDLSRMLKDSKIVKIYEKNTIGHFQI